MWDIRNPSRPVKSALVTDYLDKRLCDLYEAEAVFDKFHLNHSPCGRYAITGAYSNQGLLIDLEGKFNIQFDTIFGHKRGKVSSKY